MSPKPQQSDKTCGTENRTCHCNLSSIGLGQLNCVHSTTWPVLRYPTVTAVATVYLLCNALCHYYTKSNKCDLHTELLRSARKIGLTVRPPGWVCRFVVHHYTVRSPDSVTQVQVQTVNTSKRAQCALNGIQPLTFCIVVCEF